MEGRRKTEKEGREKNREREKVMRGNGGDMGKREGEGRGAQRKKVVGRGRENYKGGMKEVTKVKEEEGNGRSQTKGLMWEGEWILGVFGSGRGGGAEREKERQRGRVRNREKRGEMEYIYFFFLFFLFLYLFPRYRKTSKYKHRRSYTDMYNYREINEAKKEWKKEGRKK